MCSLLDSALWMFDSGGVQICRTTAGAGGEHRAWRPILSQSTVARFFTSGDTTQLEVMRRWSGSCGLAGAEGLWVDAAGRARAGRGSEDERSVGGAVVITCSIGGRSVFVGPRHCCTRAKKLSRVRCVLGRLGARPGGVSSCTMAAYRDGGGVPSGDAGTTSSSAAEDPAASAGGVPGAAAGTRGDSARKMRAFLARSASMAFCLRCLKASMLSCRFPPAEAVALSCCSALAGLACGGVT